MLRELGVLDQVLVHSGRNTHFLVQTDDGAILMNIALGGFGVPSVCMRRSDLLSILRREIVTWMLPPAIIERNVRRVYSYQS
jgi:hypothetical protein